MAKDLQESIRELDAMIGVLIEQKTAGAKALQQIIDAADYSTADELRSMAVRGLHSITSIPTVSRQSRRERNQTPA